MVDFANNKAKTKKKLQKEKIAEIIFFMCALFSIMSLFLITLFIVLKGIQPFMPWSEYGRISFIDFITGVTWSPAENLYGIGYMIIGTILATIGAILIAVPIGLLSSIAIAEILPKNIANILRSMIEILAGIPSIIYGIFGLGFIVPWIMEFSPQGQGQSLLAVIIVLAIMILPTIIVVSESAISSVPNIYKEASLGLGVTKIQTIFKVIIPVAKSGIAAAIVLGIGRALGETMAIILVAGNTSGGIATSIFDQIRPMTSNIALEMGYATGLHQEMLFATALVLFIFIMGLNIIIYKKINGWR